MDIYEDIDFSQFGGNSTEPDKPKIDWSGLLGKGQSAINDFTGGLEPVKTEIAPSQSMIILVVAILGCIMYNKK